MNQENFEITDYSKLLKLVDLTYESNGKTTEDKCKKIGAFISAGDTEARDLIAWAIESLNDDSVQNILEKYTNQIIVRDYSRNFVDANEFEKLTLWDVAYRDAKRILYKELADTNFIFKYAGTSIGKDADGKITLPYLTAKNGKIATYDLKNFKYNKSYIKMMFTGIELECETRNIQLDINEIKNYKNGLNGTETDFIRNLDTFCSAIEVSDDEQKKLIGEFFIQMNDRINSYREPFGRMLCLYGRQGSGKTTIADLICKTVSNGKVCKHNIDEILGNFGTIDIFNKICIVSDEFGRQDKNSGDILKTIITGDIYACNRKYKSVLSESVLASLILTTNTDPRFLMNSETENRRLAIIEINKRSKFGVDQLAGMIKNLWASTPLDAPWDYDEVNNQLMETSADSRIIEFLLSLQSDKSDNAGTTIFDEIFYNKKRYTITSFSKLTKCNKALSRNVLESKYFAKTECGKVVYYKFSDYGNSEFGKILVDIEK